MSKYKVVWIEKGDDGEIIEEVYVRVANKADNLFIREYERRTGKCIYVFEQFLKEIEEKDHIRLLHCPDAVFFGDEKEGCTCAIRLFRK